MFVRYLKNIIDEIKSQWFMVRVFNTTYVNLAYILILKMFINNMKYFKRKKAIYKGQVQCNTSLIFVLRSSVEI